MTNEKLKELCDENGTGLNQISQNVEEVFYPLLFSIEIGIVENYKKDKMLNDRMVMEHLKRLRDNLFNEKFEFEDFEKKIMENMSTILKVEKYSQKDVLMAISKILNSVRLHRSTEGKTGLNYLDFIEGQLNYI